MGGKCFGSCLSGGLIAIAGALAQPAFATSSLSFDGGGYSIDLEIGADQEAVVASVRFHNPGDAKGVVLPREQWTAEVFDTTHQVLILRYRGGSAGVSPFVLSVQQEAAVLVIVGRQIKSQWEWRQ